MDTLTDNEIIEQARYFNVKPSDNAIIKKIIDIYKNDDVSYYVFTPSTVQFLEELNDGTIIADSHQLRKLKKTIKHRDLPTLHIDFLPDETLLNILDNTNVKDINHLMKTNKRFLRLVHLAKPHGLLRSDQVIKSPPFLLDNVEVYIRHLSKIPLFYNKNIKNVKLELTIDVYTDNRIYNFIETNPNIEVLSLFDESAITNDFLIHVSKYCHNIKKLKLSHAYNVTDDGIIPLLDSNIGIVDIDLVDTNITDESLYVMADTNHHIRIISLQRTNITDDGLIALSRTNHDIIDLDIMRTNISDYGFSYLLEFNHNLEKVRISDTNISSNGIMVLSDTNHHLNYLKIPKDISEEAIKSVFDNNIGLSWITTQDIKIIHRNGSRERPANIAKFIAESMNP